jgi:hypothetical protein
MADVAVGAVVGEKDTEEADDEEEAGGDDVMVDIFENLFPGS